MGEDSVKTILRIQDDSGKGFYQGAFWSLKYNLYMAEKGGKHPAPYLDSKLLSENPSLFESYFCYGQNYHRFIAKDYIFGFKDVEQCRSWLFNDEWLKSLHDAKYHVAIMQGDVRIGHTQAVIHSPSCIVQSTNTILECFKLK